MTPTEQRIAIAEACGWTGVIAGAIGAVGFPPGRAEAGERRAVIPAYTEDLNEILPVIRRIPPSERDQYQNHLYRVCDRLHRMAPTTWLAITAEASVHCEAFLHHKKLWKEGV